MTVFAYRRNVKSTTQPLTTSQNNFMQRHGESIMSSLRFLCEINIHCIYAFTLAAYLLIIASATPAATFEMGEEFHTVSTKVQTPHIQWAKPLASGTLRLLVIAPRFAHRETAELMQRLDAQCDVVMMYSHKQIGADSPIVGMRENDILNTFRTQLARKHDVIIIGNFAWSLIPKPLQYEILRQVANGAGLLYVPFIKDVPELFMQLFHHESMPELLLKGTPWDSFASLRPIPEDGAEPLWYTRHTKSHDGKPKACVLRFCGTLKRGRCIVLRWRAGVGGFHCLTPEPKERIEYEYDMALVARVILWLAQRESEEKIYFHALSDTPRSVAIEVVGHATNRLIDVVIRDKHNEVELKYVPNISGTSAEIKLPAKLKGGRHFLDAWVRNRNGSVIAWASTYFDIERDGQIASVHTEREYYRPGDAIGVVVEFAKPVTKPAEMVVSAFDIYNREWAQSRVPVQAGEKSSSLELSAEGMLSTYSRLRADLMRGDRVVQRAFGELYVQLRRQPDFALGAWSGGGDSWLSRARWKLNHESGLTTTVFDGNIKSGIRPSPYSTTNFRHGGKGEVRKPCLTDPIFWRNEKEHLQKRAKSIAHADVFAYSLGDEICLDVSNTSVCRSATCLAKFREWLRKQYGTLDALNSEWETDFTNWNSVVPQSRVEAKRGGNLAPWLDHRLFMDKVFADGLNHARDIIHKIDPNVPVGAEGLWGSYSAYGMDWWLMTRKLDFLIPYWHKPLMSECIRSFKRQDCITGTWFGNYGEQSIDEEYLRWLPWNVLIHQFNSVWWYTEYRAVQFGAVATALAPDYRPTKGFKAALDEIAVIRSGIATLLLQLHREHDGIAVLYSRPSIHISRGEVNGLLIAIEEIGLQYDMVANTQLSAKWLRKHGYKLLVLPDVSVLSEREVAAIIEFVRDGGNVLAVLPPGVYDAHGKLRDDSTLNTLFGVRRLNAEVHNKLRRLQPVYGSKAFDVWQTANGLEVTDATTLAKFDNGTPAAVQQTFGAGRAILLAFSFNGFSDERTLWHTEIPMRNFLQNMLKRLEITRAFRIESSEPIRGLEVARFTDGPNEYVAATLQPLGPLRSRSHKSQRFELGMRDRKLTFDVRAGKSLGFTDTIEITMQPGDCQIFARLSAEPTAPSIEIAPKSVSPGRSVVVTIVAGGLRRVQRLTVMRPDGTEVKWWTQNVFVQNSSVKVTLYIAYNAPLGEYVVVVQDVVTRQRASARFIIE